MLIKGRTKAVSRLTAVLIVTILVSSITISIWVWDNNNLDTQNDSLLVDFEDPISSTPDVTNKTHPETNEPDEQPSETNESINASNRARILVEETEYFFDKSKVNTTRPDLFKDGQFSVFDVLVYLYHQNEIDLAYHFDE